MGAELRRWTAQTRRRVRQLHRKPYDVRDSALTLVDLDHHLLRLNAGVMEDGLVRPVDEGAPQGGPLSPLLSNLLDDLDKELERRGLRFCRDLSPWRLLRRGAEASSKRVPEAPRVPSLIRIHS